LIKQIIHNSLLNQDNQPLYEHLQKEKFYQIHQHQPLKMIFSSLQKKLKTQKRFQSLNLLFPHHKIQKPKTLFLQEEQLVQEFILLLAKRTLYETQQRSHLTGSKNKLHSLLRMFIYNTIL
jgi:hypothetical protein